MPSKVKRKGKGGKEGAPKVMKKGIETEMASDGKRKGIGGQEVASGRKGKGNGMEMASGVFGKGNGGTDMAAGAKGEGIGTKIASEVIDKGLGGTEMDSGVCGRRNRGTEMTSGVKRKGIGTEMASEVIDKGVGSTEIASKVKGKGVGSTEMASGVKGKGIGTEMASEVKGKRNGGKEVASKVMGRETDTEMASDGKKKGTGGKEVASGAKGKGIGTEMASEVIDKGIGGTEMASKVNGRRIGGTEMASGAKGKGIGTEMASEVIDTGLGSAEIASAMKGRGIRGTEMDSGIEDKGTDIEMASRVKGRGIGGREMDSGMEDKGTDIEMTSEVKGRGIGGTEMDSEMEDKGTDIEMASGVKGRGIGGREVDSGMEDKGTDTEMASGVEGRGIGGREMDSGVEGRGIGAPEAGSAEGAPPTLGSWIPRTFRQVQNMPQLRLSLPDAQPVTVLAVERYVAELPPPSQTCKSLATAIGPSQAAPWPAYYYDLTLSDGAYKERCHLCPALNPLVQKNALRCGLQVKVTKCSYMHNEKKLGCGFLCVEGLEILGVSDSGDTLQELKEYNEKLPVPLKGVKKHYLPLWNSEDPYGEMWLARKPSQEVCVDVSKVTSLIQLEQNWRIRLNFPPLLVRIMHKARLRFYGKPETKLDVPYQAYFEVADRSGMMSMVLWNSLCPEWYHSLKIGAVLLLEQYAIKSSYPFKTQAAPGDSRMERFSSIEISLNVRDPPTKISLIPEDQVKAEWKLPEVKYRFIERSELDNVPDNHCCDITGLVQYVGRTQRTRKREHGEDFWMSRCVHVIDGTSEQPFVLELFATSQPEIFEQIHPMTYLVCTQMRVIRDTAENGSSTVYLTTSNESQIFITGWHRGQPYTKDPKVKNFIQWIKTQEEASHMERMSMGGYYPFPPVPDTFSKYCKNIQVESILTTISEMEKEIESLHYREHKRLAFQGIISAVRYVSCSEASSREASGVEPGQSIETSSSQTSVTDSDHVKEGSTRHRQTGKSTSAQSSSCVQQQEHVETRRQQAKRKMAAVETREPSPAPSPRPCCTRSGAKKIMLQKHSKETSFEMNESQGVKEGATPSFQNSEEIAGVPGRVQAERTCRNSWESALWAAVKDNLTQHLNYSSVFPESFPCKFNYAHKEFLMRQYNLQPGRCKPNECARKEEAGTFEKACPLEYYEVAILGINHDIAVDVAFLPVCSEDSHLCRGKGTSSSVVLTHPSGTSSQQERIDSEGPSEIFPLADVVVKATADLEKQHVICILDICSLGEDKVEVFLNRVYDVTDVNVASQAYLTNDAASVR
ncbi:RPA-related protein RADX isoform X2 [Anolis sagrei]|uniref:RPA-related protein RADX isoform X2 n=1 Tax=Anolis sagrei TaxID=38937 RepID=UPI0035206466